MGWVEGRCSGTKTADTDSTVGDLTRRECMAWYRPNPPSRSFAELCNRGPCLRARCNAQGAACCRTEAAGGSDTDECNAHDSSGGNTIGVAVAGYDVGDWSCNDMVTTCVGCEPGRYQSSIR